MQQHTEILMFLISYLFETIKKKVCVGKKMRGDFFIINKRKAGITLQHMLRVLLVT